MLPTDQHPGQAPAQDFLTPSTEAPQAASGRRDESTRAASPWRWLFSKSHLQGQLARIHGADGIWLMIGTLLIALGGLTFFHYLAVAEIAGGCCGGGLLVLAGVILLVIGVRDRGEFSGSRAPDKGHQEPLEKG